MGPYVQNYIIGIILWYLSCCILWFFRGEWKGTFFKYQGYKNYFYKEDYTSNDFFFLYKKKIIKVYKSQKVFSRK